MINVLLVLALADGWLGRGPWMLAVYAAAMALLALPLAAVSIVRRTAEQAAEREFAAWYRPAEGATLVRRDGNWHVVSIDAYEAGEEQRASAGPTS